MKQLKIIKMKIIVSLILIITILNFIIPNYSKAVTWSDVDKEAGKLVEPIFSFVNWVGDMIIGFMQRIFLGSRRNQR